ncbi:MAG: hypothetical protein LBR29_00690 [Methylobacteriaceae bacterium]|jgi:hypothetical protein|nr:hypothetical protein [Methylobacteriaceae bacterium]
MCFLITVGAALVATALWRRQGWDNSRKLGTLSLMFWSAALMWSVDGFFNIAGGEPFLDISVDDALLGVLIVACGLAAWLVMTRRGDSSPASQRE